MARTATRYQTMDAWPDRQREAGMLVMLVAVPMVCTGLLAPMIGPTPHAIVAAIGLATSAGAIAGFSRELYIARVDQQHRRG